jgi:WG containing repeat
MTMVTKEIAKTTEKELVSIIWNYKRNHKIESNSNADYYVVENNRTYGLIDKSGKMLLPIKYGYIYTHYEVLNNSEWLTVNDIVPGNQGIYNLRTDVFVAPIYKSICPYECLMVAITSLDNSNAYIFLDLNGVALPTMKYDHIEGKNNFFICRKNKKSCFLDQNGKEIIPLIYNSLHFENTEFLLATKDGKKFYVDVTGKEYIENNI